MGQINEVESDEEYTVHRENELSARKQKQLRKLGIQIAGNKQLGYRKAIRKANKRLTTEL